MTQKKTRPVVAVDIGGTKMMIALFSAAGKMMAKTTRLTLVKEGADAAIERFCEAIREMLKSNNLSFSRLEAIGIACAGGIDSGRGVVVTASPHLPGWDNLPLAGIVKKKTGVDTYLLHDAGAAALGEQRYGAGKGLNNLVLLTLGTGIGGGIIIDGKLYFVDGGGAGEIGHMAVEAEGLKCDCGNTGCLELYASGTAIAADAVARIRSGKKSAITDMVGGKLDKITAEIVGEAAQNGDKLARDVIARAAFYLGVGLVSIVNIFSPQMIILGGGLVKLGEMIIAPGRKMVVDRSYSRKTKSVRITVGKLGNEAGVYGAAAFAFDMRKIPTGNKV